MVLIGPNVEDESQCFEVWSVCGIGCSTLLIRVGLGLKTTNDL